MGVVIRQSLRSTIFLYIGILIGIGNRLFFLPKFLTLEQLGLVDIVLSLAILLGQLSYLGIQGAITKFYSYFENKGLLNVFTGFFIIVPIVGFLFFSSFFYFFKESIIELFPKNINLLTQYYNYILPLAFFFVVKGIFSTYSSNNLRLTVPTILNDPIQRIITAFLLLLIGFQIISFTNYILYTVFGYGFVALALILYCSYYLNLKLSFKLNKISTAEYKQISNYSVFLLLAGLSNVISQYTDSIILASINGFSAAGIYSIAFFIGLSIEMPKRAISNISGTIVAKHWNNGNLKEINKLYQQSSINQGILGAFLFLLVLVSIDEIFYLLPKSEILSAGKNVAIIIGISRLIDMITGINNEIFRTSKHFKLDFVLIVFFIGLSVASNLILIPILGLEGAAYATLIAAGFYNTLRYVLLKKLYGFDPFTKSTLKLLLTLLAIIAGFYLVPDIQFDSTITAIIVIATKSVLFGGMFVLTSYRLKISEEFSQLIDKLLKRLR